MDELVAAAKAEGQLTTIALPHDWCGYGAVIDAFKAKYPEITINELNPDAGSGDEIEAIKANKDNKGPQAPDVIDVGLSFGPSAKADGLIQPYKVSTWDSIPDSAKDAEGYWYGDYYGVLSFEVNKDLVKNAPPDWADLLKDEYKNSVALAGDPRTSNQAVQGVYAAGLVEGGVRPGGCRRQAGLEFFKELNAKGNFVPVIGKAATLAQGQTPDPDHLGLQRARRPRHAERQSRRSTSSCRRPASLPASTCRRSAPTRRIRTPPSCGWSTSIRTKARSAG